MKKLTYALVACAIAGALALQSCKKEDRALSRAEMTRNNILSGGGEWKVDSLTSFSTIKVGGVLDTLSDSTYKNYGTLKFGPITTTGALPPGVARLNRGLAVHTFMPDANTTTKDTLNWAPGEGGAMENAQENLLNLFQDPGKFELTLFCDVPTISNNTIIFSTKKTYVDKDGFNNYQYLKLKLTK